MQIERKHPASSVMASHYAKLKHYPVEKRLRLDIMVARQLQQGKNGRRAKDLMTRLAKFYLYHGEYRKFADVYDCYDPQYGLLTYADKHGVAGEVGAMLAAEGNWDAVARLFETRLLEKGLLLVYLFDMMRYGTVLALLKSGSYGITSEDAAQVAMEEHRMASIHGDGATAREIWNLGLFSTSQALAYEWRIHDMLMYFEGAKLISKKKIVP